MSNTLVQEMASVLRSQNIDLGDERAVMVALTMNGFLSGDVVTFSDRAIEQARKDGVSLAEVLGDGVAGALAIGVWVAAYCIICPPGSI